jgi:hypothetical protein
MSLKTARLLTTAIFVFLGSAVAQNFEVTGQIGGQLNGGLDLATSLFHRIDVQNALNYGITAGYLLGEHGGVEFQWNRMSAGTLAQPISGFSSIRVFTLNQDQYMGNFVFHFTDRESKTRPFAFFGLGASSLDPTRSGVRGTSRFAFSVGAGVKRNLGKHFGLRGQMKYSPTYITTTNGGYWCDPFWGGCWQVGNNHYLNEFDVTGGLTVRF